jgi:hypothetical protein
MAAPTIAPYGSWKSPITADLIVSESIGVSNTWFDGEDIYWLEMRPAEKGRYVIVCQTYFYSRIFDFPLAETVEPVHIENLESENG